MWQYYNWLHCVQHFPSPSHFLMFPGSLFPLSSFCHLNWTHSGENMCFQLAVWLQLEILVKDGWYGAQKQGLYWTSKWEIWPTATSSSSVETTFKWNKNISTSWKAYTKIRQKLDSRQRQEENYWMNFRDTIYIQVPGDRQSQLSLSFKFSSSLEDRRQKKPHDSVNLHFLYW